MESFEADVVIVGAGAAGLLAAVAARGLGHNVVVVEAGSLVGGASAAGDGLLWLPGNHLMTKLNEHDSVEDATTYLDHVLGAPSVASTRARRRAYVSTAARLAKWLSSSNVPLVAVKGVPDYDPKAPGGKSQGRVVQTQPADRRVLGEWAERLRHSDLADKRSGGLFKAGREAMGRILRRGDLTGSGGEALVTGLLRRATANGVEIWLGSPLVDLIADEGRIVGVVVRREGEDVEVRAERGVLLASGGFEANQELREEYLPLPTEAAWSTTGLDNRGEALQIALAHGAATAALDEAWWVPTVIIDGEPYAIDRARTLPHGLIVDQAGDRFFNEAAPPVAAGRALYDRSRGVRAIPAFLILDNRHRQAYPLGPWPAGTTPRRAQESGDVVRANTLNDLAQALGIDRAGLLGTVVRFNGFAAKGRDLDFRRGESPWDRVAGDPGKRKNPALGKVDKPPFWALKVYPGDEGTKGGVLIDDEARVLRADGSVIPGLYACGGAAASMMKATSPAPGAALGAALVESFRAILSISDQLEHYEDEPG